MTMVPSNTAQCRALILLSTHALDPLVQELEHCVHTIVGAVRTSRMLRLQAVCEQLLGMIQQLTVDVPHERKQTHVNTDIAAPLRFLDCHARRPMQ